MTQSQEECMMSPERLMHLMTSRMRQVHGLTPEHTMRMGEDHFFHYFQSPARDEDGGPSRIVCIGIDEGDSYLSTETRGPLGPASPPSPALSTG